MSARSASAADDQTTGRSAPAMARVLLLEELVDVERRARLRLEHADTLLDLDAQRQQLLDIGEDLPAHALLVRQRQSLQGIDREFERSDHRPFPTRQCFSPDAAECNREERILAAQTLDPR